MSFIWSPVAKTSRTESESEEGNRRTRQNLIGERLCLTDFHQQAEGNKNTSICTVYCQTSNYKLNVELYKITKLPAKTQNIPLHIKPTL